MAETEKKVLKIGNFKLTILAIKKAFNCAAHTRTLSRVSKIPESFLAKKCDGLGIPQFHIGWNFNFELLFGLSIKTFI